MGQVKCKDLIARKNPTSQPLNLIKLFLLKLLDASKHWLSVTRNPPRDWQRFVWIGHQILTMI